MKTQIKNILLLFAIVLLQISFVIAQTRTITGTGNWDASNRWSGGNIGGVGSNSHDVALNKEKYITVRNGFTYTIRDLDAQQASRITIEAGGFLIITGDATIDKEVSITVSGTLEIQGSLNMGKEIRITNNSTGSINILNDFSIGKSSQITNNGFFNVLGTASTNSEGSLTGSQPLYVGTSCTGSLCSDSQIAGTLPIELTQLFVKIKEGEIDVFWETASEINNSYFELQKSYEGINYETIQIISGHGTTNIHSNYEFIDFSVKSGTSYYRLKQVDFNGDFEYSEAIVIVLPNTQTINLYPNPNSGNYFSLDNYNGPIDNISVFDSQGRIINLKNQYNQNQFDFETTLQKGIYFVKIIQGSTITAIPFVVR